ncbi:MAG: DnaB-like helicase C-terminal domain-containing protein [Gammaproteobacteria bacterium]|nr:DnaB-like helicase C-terminal domain-containing protein [Gammaproteobacteria bacterium]
METIERILIGTGIAVPGAAVTMCKRLSSDMMETETALKLFDGIKTLVDKKAEVNISNMVAATGEDRHFLAGIIKEGNSTPDVDFLIEQYLEQYRIRVEGQIALELQVAAKAKRTEDIALLHKKRQDLLERTYQLESDPQSEFNKWSASLTDRVDQRRSGKMTIPGIPTGFSDIDYCTGGWLPGEMIVVGAYPGIGKTSKGIHFAKTAAKHGYKVGFVTCEMAYRALFTRLVAHECFIDSRNIRDGNLTDMELQSVAKASEAILKSGIMIIDNILGVDAITSIIRDYTSRLGIKLWVIDYLQIITSAGHRDRRMQVSDISLKLTNTAKVMDVPIILLSQLARAVGKPKISSLKESGDIEANAHKIILLSEEDEPGFICVDLAKNRDGERGEFSKYTDRTTGRWSDDKPNGYGEVAKIETPDLVPF